MLYLGCHDKRTGCRINRDIPSHQPDVLKFLVQFPVFLVAQCFDWSRIDHSLFVPQ